MSLKNKLKKYNKYIWGLGLEHEMHIFHTPKGKNIKDFILFDSESAQKRIEEDIASGKIKLINNKKEYILNKNGINTLKRLPKENEIYIEDYIYFKSVPFEKTGRKCNGKYVIKPVPFMMPEFIIDHPICNLGSGRDIFNMSLELIKNKRTYLDILCKNKITKRQIKKYGELCELPFSMTSYLKYPEDANSTNYKFKKDKNKKDIIREEYTGSYHVSMTLPHIPVKTKLKDFINMHKNFANQLQWLEPLLLSAFFSCDQRAPGSIKKRVRGSFRVLIIGWGNLAGSDVRKFGEGIGRYCNVPIKWRNGLKLHDVDKLKPCLKPSPYAKKEGARSTLSSDFRTIGEIDEDDKKQVAKMTVGKGIEFRIFDQFNDIYIPDLVKFIVLVAENSRLHETKKYVYDDKEWKGAVHNIMENGWCAILDKKYISKMRKMLGLKIKTTSQIAFEVLQCINDELFEKHNKGMYPLIMNSSTALLKGSSLNNKPFSVNTYDFNSNNISKPKLPMINFYSWGMGFMLKLNRNNKLMESFNKLIEKIPLNKIISFIEFEKILFKCFNKRYWKKDSFNIIYFMRMCITLPNGDLIIDVEDNKDGTIKSIILLHKIKIKSFDKNIKLWFEGNKDDTYVNKL
tara:strand:- start:2110 stop:3990 length:1881 start_codon:yes stop_codon:yes gene_type:complete